ncbi:MAG TPA: archease [Afifellaceae bacterium]|nr:archease [Afifellaceae bacterium]
MAIRTGAAAGWSHFDHDADIGVCGTGPTLAAAFEQAALALTAIVTGKPVAAAWAVAITCAAPDAETLFVDWLNALVFEMATRQMLFGRYEVAIRQNGECALEGQAWGEAVDRQRHRPAVEIKGATYTGLRVHQDADGLWRAQCIVDV